VIKRPLFLSLLSGLLFAFAWPESGSITPFIFIAFLPLLYLEKLLLSDQNYRSWKIFANSYLAFFTWNLISTWWVKNASFGGAAMAIVFNALFMAVVFQLYHAIRKRLGGRFGFLILCSLWMSFEYLHLRWDLTWPWLTLGNVFASRIWMIQWYEYTGVFGGTIWILAANFALFSGIQSFYNSEIGPGRRRGIFFLLLVFLLPLIVSVALTQWGGFSFNKSKVYEIVVVQPNVDPYNEKFSTSYQAQLTRMLDLAETKIDVNTSCVIFPETALTENLWENNLRRTYSVQALQRFQQKYPKLDILIGATSAYQYQAGEIRAATARKFTDMDEYYEDYNTALFLSDTSVQKYHKSKFVPGVERMPFPALLKPLEKLAINMGGTTGSLCGQEYRSVFHSLNSPLCYAPVICYESVFGEFVTQYIKNGANLICIMTNDGWWGDSPGYRQHVAYARLRAIETRCWVARSANTGISCFIDPNGKVLDVSQWWKPTAIKGNIRPSEEKTFYVRHGDFLALLGIGIGAILLLYTQILRFRKN
jgi:apolipoprotein N-acyltransferase